MNTSLLRTAAAVLVVLASGCTQPPAWGDVNRIIVATSNDNWAEIEPVVDGALETRVLTVRPEQTFIVTQQDPTDADWVRLRRFRQVLVIGSPEESWVADALAKAEREGISTETGLLQVHDVWARGQNVTVIPTSADPGAVAADVAAQAHALHELLDSQYRQWALNRMYTSGRDSILADTLWREHRFSLVLPEVYYWRQESDSIFIFRNDNPDPAELIRQFTVSWRSPAPTEVSRDDILAWRQELVELYFSYPQVIDTLYQNSETVTVDDMNMREYQALWANPPEDEFPAGGPFVVRWFECPQQNRLYMVDAWLYAPGKDKYQYMLQLETILNSFRCPGGSTLTAGESVDG